MAYEIPQQLEYKEKIMFGLNFKQLAYLFLFGPLVIIIFFKTSLHIAIKIPIISMLSGLAIGFIFLDLDRHLRNWYYWYKSKRIELPHKFADFIPVKEIANDLIITKDDRKLAILKVSPINFSIKTEESKQAISIAFQKFLNSLDFKIQIIMSTEQLDLKDYFKDFNERLDKRFVGIFNGYKTHLENLTKENEVMNRVFYIVIEEKTDINIQLNVCQTKLTGIGIKSFRLNNNDLISLIKRFFVSANKEEENVLEEKTKA